MAAAGALALTGVVLASPAQAELNGSTFELDGDLIDVSGIDWLTDSIDTTPVSATMWDGVNLEGSVVKRDKATGTTDDSYQGGVKEDTVCPGQTTGSIPNNKSDLKTFRVFVEPGQNGHPGYLNIAWSRVAEPSGTTLMDFEFNQSETPCGSGSPNYQRTEGDLLIEYLIDQGGARIDITMRTWDDTAKKWRAPTTLDVPSAICENESGAPQPCAEGAVNDSLIPANVSGELPPVDLAQYTFGEATIDLRTIFNEEKCTSFGSAMLKSRSSDSFTSQPKDFIAPEPISLTNCGIVTIDKEVVVPAGVTAPDDAFTWVLERSGGGAIFEDDQDPVTDETQTTGDLKAADAPDKVEELIQGEDYTLSESDPGDAWELTSIVCTFDDVDYVVYSTEVDQASWEDFPVTTGGTTACVITNTLNIATLIVDKQIVSDNGGSATYANFTFDVFKEGESAYEDHALNQGFGPGAGDIEGTKSFSVPAGTFKVVEDDPSSLGYSASYGDDYTGNNAALDECVDMVIDWGDTVTCTITNNDVKNSVTPKTTQSWTITDSLTIDGWKDGADDKGTASVTFSLYEGDTCAVADQVDTETVTGITSGTVTMTEDFVVTETGLYSWVVTYTGDQYNEGFTMECGDEQTLIQAKDWGRDTITQ
jgi:hypothetical protein